VAFNHFNSWNGALRDGHRSVMHHDGRASAFALKCSDVPVRFDILQSHCPWWLDCQEDFNGNCEGNFGDEPHLRISHEKLWPRKDDFRDFRRVEDRNFSRYPSQCGQFSGMSPSEQHCFRVSLIGNLWRRLRTSSCLDRRATEIEST
jgi:hypothetical protein